MAIGINGNTPHFDIQSFSSEQASRRKFTPEQLEAIRYVLDIPLEDVFHNRASTGVSPQFSQTVTQGMSTFLTTQADAVQSLGAEVVGTAVLLDHHDVLFEDLQTQRDKIQQLHQQIRNLADLFLKLRSYSQDTANPNQLVTLDMPGATLTDLQKLAADNGLNIDWQSFAIKDGQLTQSELARLTSDIAIKIQQQIEHLDRMLDIATEKLKISQALLDKAQKIIDQIR